MTFIWILLGLLIMGAILPSYTLMRVNLAMRKKNLALKFFWKVFLFPLGLLISPLIAIIKTILLWALGESVLSNIRYALNMFLSDLTSDTERYSLSVALKRVKLFFELVIKGRERRVRFGKENPDKTFYVVRPYYFTERNVLLLQDRVSHLLYNYYRALQLIAYAVENGWIPVVDWENYGKLSHQEDYAVNGTFNGWEYYWNQPSEYHLEEVYKSKNVVLSIQNATENKFVPSCFFQAPLQSQAEAYANYCPKYDQLISLNDNTAKYVNEKQELLFPKDARILGVSVRGTVYGSEKVPKHPIQPESIELIRIIKKAVHEWKMDYVFFACEAQDLVEEMKKAFGSKLLVMPRMRYIEFPADDDVNPLYAPGQRYQTNLDYVTEMTLLSRCDSLIAGMSGGARAAIIWNANHYENMKIVDNGLW